MHGPPTCLIEPDRDDVIAAVPREAVQVSAAPAFAAGKGFRTMSPVARRCEDERLS